MVVAEGLIHWWRECDEQTTSKKPRIDVEEDVINLEQKFNFVFDSLKIVIEEELDSVNPTGGRLQIRW